MNASFVTSQYVKGDYEIIDESRIEKPGFTMEQIEELYDIKNIEEIKLMKKTVVQFPYEEFQIPDIYKSNAKQIKEDGKDYFLLYSDIYGYSEKMIKEMEDFLVSGSIDLSIMREGKYVLIPQSYSENNQVSVNDKITIYKNGERIELLVAGVYNKIPYLYISEE
jgi:hypothetical protein